GAPDRHCVGVRALARVAMPGAVRIQVLGDALFRQLRNPPPQSDRALVDLRDPHAHRLAHPARELALPVHRTRELGDGLAELRPQRPNARDLRSVAVGNADSRHWPPLHPVDCRRRKLRRCGDGRQRRRRRGCRTRSERVLLCSGMEFNLADLYEIVADEVPDRLALVAGDRRLTYGGLDERANRFAHHLLDDGVEPCDKVAIYSWDRAEWAEA